MTKTQLPLNFLKHTSKNPVQRFLINNFYNSLISLARPLYPKSILDAGCGEGFSLNHLTINGIGQKLEGVENSKVSIDLGKKLFPHLTIKQGSVYDLPYKDNSFDLIICTEVLEHLDMPSKAIKEMLRVSRKYLITSVPNEPLFMISNLLRGKNFSIWGNDPGHIQHWTLFAFKKFLKKDSVKIKTVKFPFPWIMILGKK